MAGAVDLDHACDGPVSSCCGSGGPPFAEGYRHIPIAVPGASAAELRAVGRSAGWRAAKRAGGITKTDLGVPAGTACRMYRRRHFRQFMPERLRDSACTRSRPCLLCVTDRAFPHEHHSSSRPARELRVADLFSGCGGMTRRSSRCRRTSRLRTASPVGSDSDRRGRRTKVSPHLLFRSDRNHCVSATIANWGRPAARQNGEEPEAFRSA